MIKLKRENIFANKREFMDNYRLTMRSQYGKAVEDAGTIERYTVLALMVRSAIVQQNMETKYYIIENHTRELYYFSLEFLMGRMLRNNMMSLGCYDVVKEALADINIDLEEIEDLETDPGLGNGGLGRLAACFLDSIANLDYAGNGNTIRYRNGLFKQLIVDNEQVEVPDQWLKYGNPWEVRKAHRTVDVRFYGEVEVKRKEKGNLEFHRKNTEHVLAVPYDMPIISKDGKAVNNLRMWNAEPSDDLPEGTDYRKYLSNVDDITLNLYPDDSTEEGRKLRVKQEYFFVAAGLQGIINDHLASYDNLDNLAEKVVIQLNDTHPALAVPELMRILMDKHDYSWEKAWDITKHTFAYTNHTVLQEALEKWPIAYLQTIIPRVYMIIQEIDSRFRQYLADMGKSTDFIESVAIIHDGNVRMAYLSIVGSYSVNGVAKIHSDIIKNQTFAHFYEIYPDKFNNKTNGITPRRFLQYNNPELCSLIDSKIGKEWRSDMPKIEDLMKYVGNKKLQEDFLKVKYQKKVQLADWLKKNYDITVDPDSVFDTIAKRLHAYKRQSLDIFYVMSLYFRIKEDKDFTMPKTTFFFAAKAASAYKFAKNMIKLINCVADKVNNDPEVNKFINVVFIPNYRVTVSEKLMPATDVSEQISLAGKEASGTGNMKFMMNGALTLGTLDGANVEISGLVGDDNIVIFGMKENEVLDYKARGYNAYSYYTNNYVIRQVIDSLMNNTWSDEKDDFKEIVDEFLVKGDEYMVLADFDAYREAHDKVYAYYADKHEWAKKCLVNIAKSAYFSSDRTIQEYVDDIWHLDKIRM
ncbi:MAG: glycogen/starch/alpha-glucan phosphorylase [Erysipelotrichaceae bacterium]|nr:glycogen/starch/alpha-glucan phosphorylase [Erysipelotrichaceae bacterium]